MIGHIVALSIAHRWVVVLFCVAAIASGACSLVRLPIDAVPDITNNQVQINTIAVALSPVEIEKQVTFRIETAIAGTPGLQYTRSLSRNGFSQVTAVFSDKTNIYFARQQLSERLLDVRSNLPPGAEPKMGPVSTGLGEIYMWTIAYEAADKREHDGEPGWQKNGSYLTPEGERIVTDMERSAYLRTVQDWIIRPQIKSVPGVAGVDAIGGYVKKYHVQADPAKLIALGLSFSDLVHALETNNVSRGAGYIERNGEGYVVRAGGRVESIEEIAEIVVATRGSVPVRIKNVASVSVGGEMRTGSASQNGHEVVVGTALMLIGANSRTVAAAVDAKMEEVRRTLPPGLIVQTVLNRTQLVDGTIATVSCQSRRRRAAGDSGAVRAARKFPRGGDYCAGDPGCHADDRERHVAKPYQREPDRVWARSDFGLIVDGAVIITENSLRHLAARQHALGRALSLRERLATVRRQPKKSSLPASTVRRSSSSSTSRC